MSSSISPLMHNTIADSIYNNILSKSSKYYYFLGKTNPYNIINGIEQVEDPSSTYKYELSTRKDIITIKQITNNDVSFVIPRIDWTTNTVYDYYDDNYSATYLAHSGATSINDAQFYVMTDEYNIYICLDNNNNSISLVKPIGYDTDPIVLSDGYKWKYVMNVPSALRIKFLTSFYIPVTTAINSFYYNNGAIDSIVIDNPGTGYPSNTSASITVTGVGTGAVLKPRVSTVNGEITRVDIISGGTGYVSGTTLTVVGTGTAKSGVIGSKALLTASIVNGVIDFVSIVDPGKDYSQNNTTLTIQSDTGIDAHVSAIVENGQVVDVIIDNPGHSYKSANITAFGNGGTGAKFSVNTSGGQLNTIQANVELLTVDGTIDHIQVDEQGLGYELINISIDGDGQGATAEAILSNTKLIKINILNRGSGYTCATVNLIYSGNIPTTPASARAIISPKYGHGKNAITQLFANTLMLYSTISNTNTSGFNFNNDYRQFGIIKNPTKFDSQLLFGESIGTACYVVQGNVSNGSIVDDMSLSDTSGNKYTVISVTIISGSSIKALLQPMDNSVPIVGQNLTNGAINFNLISIINPTIDKYSGDMLYMDNRPAFYQTEDQTVTLQTILKF